jgi:hypothetical protein
MSEGWTERIVQLDKQNMVTILEAAGMAFPEGRRRGTLADPSEVVIVVIARQQLQGYVSYCRDARDPRDIYIDSIQLDADYRDLYSLPILVVECAKALRAESFRRLTRRDSAQQ